MPATALLPLLEEGLVFFRRALAVYHMYGNLSHVASFHDALPDNELRHHKSIMGEEAYLFLLGRATVKAIADVNHDKTIPLEDRMNQIDTGVLLAIKEYLEIRTSNDARTCVVEYAHALGQVFQLMDDEFATRCRVYLTDPSGSYTLEDPVLKLIADPNRQVPSTSLGILSDLGVGPNEWALITSPEAAAFLGEKWNETLSDLPTSMAKPHKSQTFVGLILRGASTMAKVCESDLPILGGRDAISLSMFGLIRPVPQPFQRVLLRPDHTITQEMVVSMSNSVMSQKGWVFVPDDRCWMPASDTVWDSAKNAFASKRAVNLAFQASKNPANAASSSITGIVEKGINLAIKHFVGGKYSAMKSAYDTFKSII